MQPELEPCNVQAGLPRVAKDWPSRTTSLTYGGESVEKKKHHVSPD